LHSHFPAQLNGNNAHARPVISGVCRTLPDNLSFIQISVRIVSRLQRARCRRADSQQYCYLPLSDAKSSGFCSKMSLSPSESSSDEHDQAIISLSELPPTASSDSSTAELGLCTGECLRSFIVKKEDYCTGPCGLVFCASCKLENGSPCKDCYRFSCLECWDLNNMDCGRCATPASSPGGVPKRICLANEGQETQVPFESSLLKQEASKEVLKHTLNMSEKPRKYFISKECRMKKNTYCLGCSLCC